jgi:ATP-binding cassette subfamily C protein CydC
MSARELPANEAGAWALGLRVLRLFRPHWPWMALGVALALASTLAGIGLLAVSGWFLASMGLAGLAAASFDYFTPAALIRLLALVRIAGRYGERLLNHDATLRALSALRGWLFGRLLPLAPARTGFLADADLFSRLRADVDRLEHAYLGVFVPIAVAVVAVPAVLLVQAAYVWPMAVLTLAAVLLAGVLLPWRLLRAGLAPGAELVAVEARLRALAGDAVLGAAELAVYGADAARAHELAELTRAHGALRARIDRLQGWGGAAVPLAAQLVAAACLLLGAAALRSHALAPPDLAMLVLLALAAFEAVGPLPEALAQFGATLASARRVFALADAEPAVREPAAPAPAPGGVDLRLRGVRLRYADDAPWALDGLDLDLPAGRRVALVGASGAGKSSLVGALLRFHPYQAGRIELDGRPIEDYAGEDVRALVAVVEQRSHIFGASLRDNLLVARPEAGEEALRAVLAAAQLEDFVAGLPQGLDTWLGEGGVLVSGGEARRVAIARALLADRPLLVLDEPTEGLDAATAQALLGALANLARGRSVLLITHRLGGLAGLVEERLVLAGGRIVAREPVHAAPADVPAPASAAAQARGTKRSAAEFMQ